MDASTINSEFLKLSHTISKNIKNIELSKDQNYLFSNSSNFKDLNNKTNIRINKLIERLAGFSSKKPIDCELDYKDVVKNVDILLDKISKDVEIVKGIRNENSEFNPNAFSNKLLPKKDVIKPELNEELDIDNSYYPFVPKIKIKYNKLTELEQDLIDCQEFRNKNAEQFNNYKYSDYKTNKDVCPFKHPYKGEVEEFYQQFVKNTDCISSFYNEITNENPIYDKICRKLAFKGFITNDFYEEVLKSKKFDSEFEKTLKQYVDDEFKIKTCDLSKISLEELFFDHVYTERKNKLTTENYNADHSSFSKLSPLKIDERKLLGFVCKKELVFENITFEFINELDAYSKMLNELFLVDEIAIDLEAHSRESYQGLTCLIQISTRQKDYVVDCIKLRSQMYLLNKIFTDCRILKILHGSDYDIVWLQRDFGVYIVNSFDTGIAASYLKYPSKSLAYLLKSICDVEADKKYQLADWRIRPLPKEMVKYAKEDTHYLFKIYDYLKNQLIIKSISGEESEYLLYSYCNVVKKSNELSLQIYEKPLVKGNLYYSVIEKCLLKSGQIKILKVILKFRDYVARKLDYSAHAIFDNFTAKELAKLSFKDLTIENILILLKQKNCSNRFYPFIEELKNLMVEKYKKIDGQIDLICLKNEKISIPALMENEKNKNDKVLIKKIKNQEIITPDDKNHFRTNDGKKNKSFFQLIKPELSSTLKGQKLELINEKSKFFNFVTSNDNNQNTNKNPDIISKQKINNLNNLTKDEEICLKKNEHFENIVRCFDNFSIVSHLKEVFEIDLKIKKRKINLL